MGCSLPAQCYSGVQEVERDSGCVLWWGCFPQEGSGLSLGTHYPQKCQRWKNKWSLKLGLVEIPTTGQKPLSVYGSVQGLLGNFTCPFLVTFFNSIFHSLRKQPEFLEITNSRCNSPSSTAHFNGRNSSSYTEVLSTEASKHRSHLWVVMGTALRQCC